MNFYIKMGIRQKVEQISIFERKRSDTSAMLAGDFVYSFHDGLRVIYNRNSLKRFKQ